MNVLNPEDEQQPNDGEIGMDATRLKQQVLDDDFECLYSASTAAGSLGN
jgi:hypothetical protein